MKICKVQKTTEREIRTKFKLQIKNNAKECNDYPGSYLVDHDKPIFTVELNLDYMLISTLRNNIKLVLQFCVC